MTPNEAWNFDREVGWVVRVKSKSGSGSAKWAVVSGGLLRKKLSFTQLQSLCDAITDAEEFGISTCGNWTVTKILDRNSVPGYAILHNRGGRTFPIGLAELQAEPFLASAFAALSLREEHLINTRKSKLTHDRKPVYRAGQAR
ncbi:hypothetical protein GPX89_40290 [Nocardia sp. ET3-3]|uniref:Uncharacterized protein n=1 Tax=Nocardia terrae TaxID=2675851 RepID=A0A7K1V9Z0_9NOCA|nr:hypothetical protein [Nocardia terrae]MVU83465.1 hypothetical protein [Nocardia terrae]